MELAKYRTESQLEIKDALQIWLVLFVPAPQVNKNAKSCKRKVGLLCPTTTSAPPLSRRSQNVTFFGG